MSRRLDPFARPLDRALLRLRFHGLPYRCDERHLNTWHAVCPVCRTPDWMLVIREHGRGGTIDLRCGAGCIDAEVSTALERDPADARIEAAELRASDALQLAEDAHGIAARALALAGITTQPIELRRAA